MTKETSINIYQSVLPGVVEVDPQIHMDTRGFMGETYRHALLEEMTGRRISWKQGNVSVSRLHAIRGFHFSVAPEGQDKYVTCLHGVVWDVVLDVRENSPTFGEWQGFSLSGMNLKSIYIPTGYAHGFMAMTENAVVGYQLSSTYDPAHEHGVNPMGSAEGLTWGNVTQPILSVKDRDAPTLEKARTRGMLPRYIDTAHEMK